MVQKTRSDNGVARPESSTGVAAGAELLNEHLPAGLLAAIDERHEALPRCLAERNRSDLDLPTGCRRVVIRTLFLSSIERSGVSVTEELRHWAGRLLPVLPPLAEGPLRAEWLGRIDEHLLGKVLRRGRRGQLHVETDPRLKRQSGVFYTPRPIVDFIVERTLGPVCAKGGPAKPRVLDPACGGGAFLLAAYQYLLERVPARTVTDRRQVLLDHVHGVDLDPQAAETTRLALVLRLLEGIHHDELHRLRLAPLLKQLERNIRVGNALHGFDWHAGFPNAMNAGGFHVVLGNPPFGASLTKHERLLLGRQYQAGTTDTAALLMLQAQRLTRPGGYCGLIVPKPFVYSSTWERVRERLLPELKTLLDVGKAWKDVKLEQAVYVLKRGEQTAHYQCVRRDGARFLPLAKVVKDECRTFGLLVNDVGPEELALARKLRSSGVFLGHLVSNTRGAMLQRQVTRHGAGRWIIGGKQLACYRIVGAKGRLPDDVVVPDNARVERGSLLVQNIVAHVQHPVDHIRIIATLAGSEAGDIVILDTVNQLKNHSPLSSHFLLGVLLSRVVSWYVYRFIFGKAVRTMHFDGPVTNRIPLPNLNLSQPNDRRRHDEVTRLVGALLRMPRRAPHAPRLAAAQERLDALLYQLYRLSECAIALVERSQPSAFGYRLSAIGRKNTVSRPPKPAARRLLFSLALA